MSNSEQSSSPQLFQCPTCGAGLPIPDAPTIRCSYCGSSVVVPSELRPRRNVEGVISIEPVAVEMPAAPIKLDSKQKNRLKFFLGCIIFMVVASIVVSGILAAAGVFATTRTISGAIDSVVTLQVPSRTPTEVSVPTESPFPTRVPKVNLVLEFGSEGTGPGQFQDARHIAVDAQGNIYVADYDTGRLQKFDSSGKFQQLVNVEVNRNEYAIVMDMAADYRGSLYVVRVPDILIYSTADLSLTSTIPGRFPEVNYKFLAIDPANTIYAVSDGSQFTDLIKMNSNGDFLWVVQGVIYNLDKRANPSVDDVAVDGLGASYVVNDIDARVYKYDAQGSYVDRFGTKGDEKGQLDNPDRIVVNPKGQVVIADLDGFDFFSSDGEFLDGFDWDYSFGGIRSFTFDLEGSLYVITTNQQVLKFVINL